MNEAIKSCLSLLYEGCAKNRRKTEKLVLGAAGVN